MNTGIGRGPPFCFQSSDSCLWHSSEKGFDIMSLESHRATQAGRRRARRGAVGIPRVRTRYMDMPCAHPQRRRGARIPVFYTGATKGKMALVTFAETKVTRPRCRNPIIVFPGIAGAIQGRVISRYVNGQGSHTYTYPVIAGSYLGVAVAGGSVSPTLLQDLQTKLTNTKTKLESGDAGLIGTLTREDILGDMFHVGTLGYFGQYIALSHVAGQPQKARHQLPYGYGTFGYEPNVQRFFGIPKAITPGGVAVNVRLGWVVHSLDGDSTKRLQLSLQTGILSSALEHVVPEQMFSTPTQPAQGVSAVKALQIASSQGQRIYHITQQNQTQALPNLHLDGLAISEITQALATGKEVIAHTDRISVPGWTGEGYFLFDPVSGSGAYKITGGGNGGFVSLADIFKSLIWFEFAKFITAGELLGVAKEVLKTLGRWNALFGYVFGLIDIALKCSGNAQAFSVAVSALTAMAVVAIYALSLSPLGIIANLILGYAIGFFISWLKNLLLDNLGCVVSRRFKSLLSNIA